MNLFDSHCHYNDEKFDEDRDEIIKQNFKEISNAVVAGYNLEGSKKAIEIAEKLSQATTDAEKQILGKYAGWGGLANAFSDSEKDAELKSLLTPDEYSSARSSTLNSHYTDPSIIKELFKSLEKMGFSNGNVLEPSCGIGNFFGSMPESMKDSTRHLRTAV